MYNWAWISKRELIDLYIGQKLNASQIAKKVGYSGTTIRRWLKKYQIPTRTQSEILHLSQGNHVSLNQEALSFLYGELLGDGSVTAYSKYSARYSAASQYLSYVQWISEKFLDYGIKGSPILEKGYQSRDTIIFIYCSHSYVELKSIREPFYPNGKKIIPRSIKLDSLMLRHWFIGDGSLKHGERGRSHIRLSTDGFSPKDVEFGVALLRKSGFIAERNPAKNIIRISSYSTAKFLDYIGPCPPEIKDIYGYKWEYKRENKSQLKLDLK